MVPFTDLGNQVRDSIKAREQAESMLRKEEWNFVAKIRANGRIFDKLLLSDLSRNLNLHENKEHPFVKISRKKIRKLPESRRKKIIEKISSSILTKARAEREQDGCFQRGGFVIARAYLLEKRFSSLPRLRK